MSAPAPHAPSARYLTLVAASALFVASCAQQSVDTPPRSVLFFNPVSAQLDAPASRVIAEFAADARTAPRRAIVVAGYAGPLQSDAASRDLAKLRAQVVVDSLVAQGVSQARIRQRLRPAVESDTGLEDRRVEMRLDD